jgi:hypothetical protein
MGFAEVGGGERVCEVVRGRFSLYVSDKTWYCLDFTIVARCIVGEYMGSFAHLEARSRALRVVIGSWSRGL